MVIYISIQLNETSIDVAFSLVNRPVENRKMSRTCVDCNGGTCFVKPIEDSYKLHTIHIKEHIYNCIKKVGEHQIIPSDTSNYCNHASAMYTEEMMKVTQPALFLK